MTNPADVLVANWSFGKPVAFDLITSPLNPSILSEAGVMAGSAALVAECHKHDSNGPKCSELGWKCTPLAVETYGCWGAEARETLSRLATRLAIPMRCTKSKATAPIYGKLSLTLFEVSKAIRTTSSATAVNKAVSTATVIRSGLGLVNNISNHKFVTEARFRIPADVLVTNWSFGKPVAFDLITSPLNPSILSEAGVMAGSAALVAECHKHDSNGPKCSELGWKCTPLAVETYGCWGAEARETLSRLATRLAIPMRCTKSKATAPIYGKLSLTLIYVFFIFLPPIDTQKSMSRKF
eukprot:Em0002g424a